MFSGKTPSSAHSPPGETRAPLPQGDTKTQRVFFTKTPAPQRILKNHKSKNMDFLWTQKRNVPTSVANGKTKKILWGAGGLHKNAVAFLCHLAVSGALCGFPLRFPEQNSTQFRNNGIRETGKIRIKRSKMHSEENRRLSIQN